MVLSSMERMKINRKDKYGRRQGIWKMFNSVGEPVCVVTYKDGILHGKWESYSGCRIKTQGLRKDGNRYGLWREYYPSGSIYSEEFYIKGKRHGLCTVFDSRGIVLFKGMFINGRRSGLRYDHVYKKLK